MSKLDEIFEHKITDIIRPIHRMDDESSIFLSVVHRMLEECPGGVQYHYYCRALSDSGVGNNIIKFNGAEVEACDMKSEMVKIDEARDKRQRIEYTKSQEMREEVRAMLKERRKEHDTSTDGGNSIEEN